nr:type III-A CRISPR-associated protein Csm2 [Saprospiraceae bacterium]
MANGRDGNFGNQRGGYRDRDERPQKIYSKKIDINWVTGQQPINNEAIDWASHFGEYLAPINKNDKDAMTTSQIRKFFGEVKRIQADFDKYKDDVPM